MPHAARALVYFWLRVGAALPMALLALVAVLSHARGHGAYELECCHDRDCAPISEQQKRVADGGVYITLGPGDHPMMQNELGSRTWFVPREKFRRPLNGEWHACLSPSLEMLCVYPPIEGA